MKRKLCGKCLKIKDISEFHKYSPSGTGVKSICRDCYNRYRRNRYKGMHPAYGFGPDMFITPGGRLAFDEPGTVVLPAVPPRTDLKRQEKGHDKVKRAIARGHLVPPAKCSVCGQSAKEVGQLVAHHLDYSKPLSVVFLCRSCHAITHRIARGKGTR